MYAEKKKEEKLAGSKKETEAAKWQICCEQRNKMELWSVRLEKVLTINEQNCATRKKLSTHTHMRFAYIIATSPASSLYVQL